MSPNELPTLDLRSRRSDEELGHRGHLLLLHVTTLVALVSLAAPVVQNLLGRVSPVALAADDGDEARVVASVAVPDLDIRPGDRIVAIDDFTVRSSFAFPDVSVASTPAPPRANVFVLRDGPESPRREVVVPRIRAPLPPLHWISSLLILALVLLVAVTGSWVAATPRDWPGVAACLRCCLAIQAGCAALFLGRAHADWLLPVREAPLPTLSVSLIMLALVSFPIAGLFFLRTLMELRGESASKHRQRLHRAGAALSVSGLLALATFMATVGLLPGSMEAIERHADLLFLLSVVTLLVLLAGGALGCWLCIEIIWRALRPASAARGIARHQLRLVRDGLILSGSLPLLELAFSLAAGELGPVATLTDTLKLTLVTIPISGLALAVSRRELWRARDLARRAVRLGQPPLVGLLVAIAGLRAFAELPPDTVPGASWIRLAIVAVVTLSAVRMARALAPDPLGPEDSDESPSVARILEQVRDVTARNGHPREAIAALAEGLDCEPAAYFEAGGDSPSFHHGELARLLRYREAMFTQSSRPELRLLTDEGPTWATRLDDGGLLLLGPRASGFLLDADERARIRTVLNTSSQPA